MYKDCINFDTVAITGTRATKTNSAALAPADAKVRLAHGVGQVAVWEFDPDMDALTTSVEMNRLCGFPDDARPTAEDLRACYAPGERQRLKAAAQAALTQPDTKMQTAFRQFWPDGTERWLLLRAQLAPTLSQPKRLIGVLIDVTDSTQREVRLEAVARELQHRLLNAIAVISAIASSTFRDNADASVALVDFKARLLAMGKTTKLMFSGEDHRAVRLSELVSLIVAPYAGATHGAFEIRGDEVMVPGLVASSLAMALHELCTNAVKYGALSAEAGLVRLKWQQDREGCLIVTWKEQNGPPVVPPKHKGFGSMLLNQVLFRYPDKVDLEFQPGGLSCRIRTRIIGAASDSGQ